MLYMQRHSVPYLCSGCMRNRCHVTWRLDRCLSSLPIKLDATSPLDGNAITLLGCLEGPCLRRRPV